MKKLKIAIVDIIGLNYDGSTLTKKGIGGSESSIISIARELAKIGFDVSVFNDCDTDDTQPGTYDSVTYYPVSALGQQDFKFDIVISQRTVIPFAPRDLYEQVQQPPPRDHDPAIFAQLQRPEQLKILWMQDTFIWGDHLLEHLVINNYINEIFCISDWHISYTTHSSHGPRRNFEVLKDKIFLTRNAINRWINWVDVKKKDPNLFVYNASITKGMIPLVEKIWPKIKQKLPQAKLKIIGGYYKFRTEEISGAAQQVMALQESVKHDSSVEFTGIIPQPVIADIMAEASYNLFPGAYPETSGISSLESINYNTPIIGVRFGAMEETATEDAGYYIDYAIEPNSLFPWINQDSQVDRYVDLVMRAFNDPYLHQQKQYACNAVKEVSTWDTVALQWKQHFYHKLDLKLDPVEQEKVEWINYRVHRTFKRRYLNPEEVVVPLPPTQMTVLPAPRVKLAFIDIVGMSYDGDTLNKKGLGGSESAVILISKQLAKIGFDVTVFNGCDEDGASPGVYDGVRYRPLSDIAHNAETYDVVISSRCVTPFITEPWYAYPQTSNRKFDYKDFENLRNAAKLKIFWMHDTFCWGDDILEDLTLSGAIDEIWTLSDFHAMYVMNCSHPKLRNYEVLRRHMWTTRNGLVKYFDHVDIDSKDPNLFIFNANMSKGLSPLLNSIWPKIKKSLPDARLIVIGGFYKLGSAFAHDNEEAEFMKIAGIHLGDFTITFTGIISQREVAEICARASYFIYPAALPETYGISTIEALYANTPLLTCRFGALGETASKYSYYLDYAIQPNGLFPNINQEEQSERFVKMVIDAYNNPVEHRRRMQALDEVKDLLGWDVTALEWKQHIYNKLGLYLSREEQQMAAYTKSKYHDVFQRKLSTSEEWLAPKQTAERPIIVISPFYNAENYIEKCILSVAAQNYDNYEHWLIDDASTDQTYSVAMRLIQNLPENIKGKFRIFRNTENRGAVYNHVSAIRSLDDSFVAMLLDGDDSLANRSDIFDYYNHIHQNYDFTYGSSWSMVDSIPLVSQPYPPDIQINKLYKSYKFNWNMPYTHLRTLKAGLLKHEPDSVFQDSTGAWYKAGGDNATFYRALENADPARVYAVPDIVYNYNDLNPLNDYKVNKTEQDNAIAEILNNPVPEKTETIVDTVSVAADAVVQPATKKRILLAIPTNRNIEAQTFKSIYDLEVPDGYQIEFQYFWGYQVDQVRNLIADWVIRGNYDYLFSVDSDIAFSTDTLKKMLSHDVDMVSGIYIQRIPNTHTIEIMRKTPTGGVAHIDFADIVGQGLVPIDGCGFGCVLIKSEVFKAIPYPHFVYKSAIDHANTYSEDVYFCTQARDHGFKIWADTSIICDHIGSWTFKVDQTIAPKKVENSTQARLRELGNMPLLPAEHVNYLKRMKEEMNVTPKVIYDIGASVLHWTNRAKEVWPSAEFYAFEAMESTEFLFQETQIPYNIGLLSDQDGKEIAFYENTEHPAGNSYYQENTEYSPAAAHLFSDEHRVIKHSITLDTVVRTKGFPLPDMIKMDVQGAEMDILKGATYTLQNCRDLILELQHVEYNKGAPLKDEVIAYVKSIGFKLVTERFSGSVGDGDYHFTRI
jgi:FkbM family methyltransferase